MSRIRIQQISQVAARTFVAAAAAFACWAAIAFWISTCGTHPTAVLSPLCAVGIGSWVSGRVRPANRWQLPLGIVCIGFVWFLPDFVTGGLVAMAGRGAGAWSFLLPAAALAALAWILPNAFPSLTDKHAIRQTLIGIASGTLAALFHYSLEWSLSLTATILILIAVVANSTLQPSGTKSAPGNPVAGLAIGIACSGGLVMLQSLFLLQLTFFAGATIACCLVALLFTLRPFQVVLTQKPILVAIVGGTLLMPFVLTKLIGMNLQWNATLDSVGGMVAIRSLQVMGVIAAGWLLSFAVSALKDQKTLIGLSDVLFGSVVGMAMAATGWKPEWIYGTACFCLLAPGFKPTGIARYLTVGCVALVAIVCVASTNSSRQTSQLLFSARAAAGFRSGADLKLISQSNCVRLLDAAQTLQGEITAWKMAGDSIEIRDRGIAIGQISTNTFATPRPITETLPSLLPVALHRRPQSILLLGDTCGISERVCRNFPLHTIVSVRSSPQKSDFVRRFFNDDDSDLPAGHVTFVDQPVETALHSQLAPQPFDVVVANTLSPLSSEAMSQLSRDFYESVVGQLSTDGLFCQRLQQYDVGGAMVRSVLTNLHGVFPRVMVFQVVPGELLFVAARNPDSVLDEALLTRLQKEHFAAEIGRSGWDWSQVASLPILDTADPVGIFQEVTPKNSIAAGSGLLAFGLSLEGLRWAPKTSELMADFGRYQQRLADATPRGPGYGEYARRFSAVIQQSEILSARFDYAYEYRKSLRMEMQQNARPPLERVVNGKTSRTADPRDEYRKDYFRSLGTVLSQLKEGDVDPLSLSDLTRFTGRYEPLLSFFAHDELIRIHENADHPSPALEFLHRLHTVYFSDGRDYNVKRVAATIQQLLDDPELVEDDQQRFDHLNSLVQELVRRWHGRVGYEPPSAARTQVEVDLCIETANRALEVMSTLRDAVGMSRDEFLARRAYVNQELVTRLRDYSETVLAHRLKNESPAVEQQQELENPLLIRPDSLPTN